MSCATKFLPMSERGDEVKTAMNSVINNISSVQTTFIPQKSFKLVIYVLNYCPETGEKEKDFSYTKYNSLFQYSEYSITRPSPVSIVN